MKCIRCGLIRSGRHDPTFVCDDCVEFSPLVLEVWRDVNAKMGSLQEIDPDSEPVFKLLADTTFITALNPQTRIFYRVCEALVEAALKGQTEMADVELANAVRTTRSFVDIYRILTDLSLINIRDEKFRRVLMFEDKLVKFASQFMNGTPVSEQVTTRLAHVYAGYILLYVLSQVATINEERESEELPYGQRPQSLWVTLMFLWGTASQKQNEFMLDDLRAFLARRGIPSSTAGNLGRALQAVDGKTTQTLIRDSESVGSDRKLTFEPYVIRELERIRERERQRT